MKALRVEAFGPLANLRIEEISDAALPPKSVRIEIEAAGVNPSDIGVALGRFSQVTLPRTPGRDFAGRVIEGDPKYVGMRVWGSGGGVLGLTADGSHAEHMILPEDAVIARPARLSAEQAAVAGVPFVTAWSALVESAGFTAGEWVIVAGAAGAVGMSAITLARALGGKAIALVRSDTSTASLDDMAVEAVLRSDVDDVPKAVMELTGGRGAAVALNGVGASVFPALAGSLAKDGRMVIYSVLGGRETPLDLFAFYRRRLRLYGLDTASFDLHEIARLYGKFGPLFESGAIDPPAIAARIALSNAREAYERVNRGDAGKVVIVPDSATKTEAAFVAEAGSRSIPDEASLAVPV
ncbi:MAG TPA: zinc-binding alcohol dehydrogenase family protein [Candidatus Cybelea sp.]